MARKDNDGDHLGFETECKEEAALQDFPQFLLKVARFKGTTRDEFLDNRQFHGNAFALMHRAEQFLIESLPIAGRIGRAWMASSFANGPDNRENA
ncbi:MAG TPA: hypothetical protein VFA14_06275 [Herbaspirillum sp.]|jgi:hypothetical protein|nr:hypothetical protein [Herbaspirillum sp.]